MSIIHQSDVRAEATPGLWRETIAELRVNFDYFPGVLNGRRNLTTRQFSPFAYLRKMAPAAGTEPLPSASAIQRLNHYTTMVGLNDQLLQWQEQRWPMGYHGRFGTKNTLAAAQVGNGSTMFPIAHRIAWRSHLLGVFINKFARLYAQLGGQSWMFVEFKILNSSALRAKLLSDSWIQVCHNTQCISMKKRNHAHRQDSNL